MCSYYGKLCISRLIFIIISMNDSIDYVALVEQHMKDEEMARRLQEEENRNRLGQSRPSLPPIVENIERRLSSSNRPTISSAPIERDFIDLTDEFEGQNFLRIRLIKFHPFSEKMCFYYFT